VKRMELPPSISLGEIGVARERGTLRTLLGSCIGLAIYDQRLKLAGLAHIVLPESRGTTNLPGKFADTAVPEVLRRLEAMAGGEPLRLLAKLAGGANMFGHPGPVRPIGEENLAAVERLLDQRKIAIVGRSVGGRQGRRMSLDVATGVVTIDLLGSATMII
jgi:chemotaxis protein CheD